MSSGFPCEFCEVIDEPRETRSNASMFAAWKLCRCTSRMRDSKEGCLPTGCRAAAPIDVLPSFPAEARPRPALLAGGGGRFDDADIRLIVGGWELKLLLVPAAALCLVSSDAFVLYLLRSTLSLSISSDSDITATSLRSLLLREQASSPGVAKQHKAARTVSSGSLIRGH